MSSGHRALQEPFRPSSISTLPSLGRAQKAEGQSCQEAGTEEPHRVNFKNAFLSVAASQELSKMCSFPRLLSLPSNSSHWACRDRFEKRELRTEKGRVHSIMSNFSFSIWPLQKEAEACQLFCL